MYNLLNKKKIDYLVGNKEIFSQAIVPYDNIICEFLGEFSNELVKDKSSKKYSDLKTLGFWCRKQNIYNLKKKFLTDKTRVGLGLIFHITPSNIPTNFAYSLIFGLITGNSNIVKVPSKKFEQITIVCKILKKILNKAKFNLLKKMICVVRYSENSEFTKKISSICNARLIWGGNESIKNIRTFKLQERAIDIAFADRYSFCFIDSKKILKASEYEINQLVSKFYNDTYLVDQNACSSPHLIVWFGKEMKKARLRFWNLLNNLVEKKYDLPDLASIYKFNQLCGNIIKFKNIKKQERFGNSIYTVILNDLDKNPDNLRGKWGFFYEFETSNLKKIAKFINNKYQTLTYYGFEKEKLKSFVIENNLSGIDRIVPIGQALEIGLNWDGYDINSTLTRIVEIK
jgi:hypothetical protein